MARGDESLLAGERGLGPATPRARVTHFMSHPTESVRLLSVRSAVWSTGGMLAANALRLAGNVAVAWLLAPEVFGLMVLVNVFMQGVNQLAAANVGTAVVQNPRGEEPSFLNTAWTLQIIRGAAVAGVAVVGAPLYAWAYSKPELAPLIMFTALNLLLSGLRPMGFPLSRKRMALGRNTLVGIAGQFVGIVVMVAVAYVHRSVWALAAGPVATGLVTTGLGYLLLPKHRHRLRWDRGAVREIFRFMRWIVLSSWLTFFALSADRLILGALISESKLGVFGIALGMAEIVRQVSQKLQSSVVFPAVSKRQHLPRHELRRKLIDARRKPLFACAIGLALLVAFGDLIFVVLYDQRYVEAGWMFRVLAGGMWLILALGMVRPALGAVGHPEYSTLAYALRLVVVLPGVYFGYQHFGMPGAVAAVALSDLPTYFGFAIGLKRQGLLTLGQDALATATFIGVTASLMALRFAISGTW